MQKEKWKWYKKIYINYFRGDKCSKPTPYLYWRKTKDKYTYKVRLT